MKDADGLTSRQRAFVNAVVAGQSHTDAAVAAGYKPSAARMAAHRLLQNVTVVTLCQAHVAEVTARVVETTVVTKEWLAAELKVQVMAARGLKQTAAGNRAIELLGKLHGHFVERVEFSDAELEAMTLDEWKLLASGRMPPRLKVVR